MIWLKLVSWYRAILKRTGKQIEDAQYLVMYVDPDNLDAIIARLHEHNYFYNDFSFRFKGQLYNARKIIGDYQIHLRIYKSGWLTGHYEAKTEHPSDHLIGIGYRLLTHEEKEEIIRMLKGFADDAEIL